MGGTCREWWQNCAVSVDAEIEAIDRLEDDLGELDPALRRVRGLIGTLELCHHKAERWIENIVAAIAAGDTDKGLGTRPGGQRHPAEERWQRICDELSRWSSGELADTSVLLAPLGKPNPLKVWQVERVVEKIRSLVDWPDHDDEYAWLVLGGGDGCPEVYRDHADHWNATLQSTITDSVDGQRARLSLAHAIDMLWPCHWRFEDNLRLVLAAIGGDLTPREPFAACGRNLRMLPDRSRLEDLSADLRAYGAPRAHGEPLPTVLAALGSPTPGRRWLVASLEKTIRLQLDPPDDIKAGLAEAGLL